MPILLNQAQLSVKNENGQYVGINTITERTTAEQIEDINSAADARIAEMQGIKNEIDTAAQTYIDQMYSGTQPGFPEYYEKVQDLDQNIIKISETQPIQTSNKLWIKDGNITETQFPTMEDINNIVAPAYDTESSYAIGDYCIQDGYLYRCNTTIASGEAWTQGHWTKVDVGGEVSDLKSATNILYSTQSGADLWEQGAPGSSSSRRVKTKEPINNLISIEPTDGYAFMLFAIGQGYLTSARTFVATMAEGAWVMRTEKNIQTLISPFTSNDYTWYAVGMELNSADITPSDVSGFILKRSKLDDLNTIINNIQIASVEETATYILA